MLRKLFNRVTEWVKQRWGKATFGYKEDIADAVNDNFAIYYADQIQSTYGPLKATNFESVAAEVNAQNKNILNKYTAATLGFMRSTLDRNKQDVRSITNENDLQNEFEITAAMLCTHYHTAMILLHPKYYPSRVSADIYPTAKKRIDDMDKGFTTAFKEFCTHYVEAKYALKGMKEVDKERTAYHVNRIINRLPQAKGWER